MRTMMITGLLAVVPALAGAAGPRVGLSVGTAQGTTLGALVRITDRLTSRSTLRVPEWGAVAELDVTCDVLSGRAFVPYLGTGIELRADGEGGTERTESRAIVGVRHHPTDRVRLFGEAVWHRRLGGASLPEDANVNVRLGAGVAVMF